LQRSEDAAEVPGDVWRRHHGDLNSTWGTPEEGMTTDIRNSMEVNQELNREEEA